jgi:hypothetical protein
MKKEILKAEIEKIGKNIDKKVFEVSDLNDTLTAKKKELAELEAEKSAAEEWHHKQGFPKIDNESDTEKDIITLKFSDFCSAMKHDRITAHEAGQAHATTTTHEIYRQILAELQKYIRTNSDGWSNIFSDLINNLDPFNQPTQEEKPGIVGYLTNVVTSRNHSKASKVSFYVDPHHDIKAEKYKLTPIED